MLPACTPAHRKDIECKLRDFYRAEPPVAAEFMVVAGDAADEVLRVADEVNADLIVMGTHGRGGLDRVICGSVAERVLRRSGRPVLVVRTVDASRSVDSIGLIVHPTDFSERSRPAIGVATALARANRARLVIMHVAPVELVAGGAFQAPDDLHAERAELARMREEAARAGLDGSVETLLGRGDPANEINRTAAEMGCNLIVLGSSGRTGLRRLLMGSVAESVIRQAPCLALVVKDDRGIPAEAVEGAPVAEAVAPG